MKRKQLTVTITLVLWVFVAGYARAEWITIDYPSSYATYPYGIDGSNIVGEYLDASAIRHGFLYDGVSWTSLDYPGSVQTRAFGIDGDKIVGAYLPDWWGGWLPFIYDGTTWSWLTCPGIPADIDGDNIVGSFQDWWTLRPHGFIGDGVTWTVLNNPEAFGTALSGIDGDKIVAQCEVGWLEGFLYDGTSWTSLGSGNFPYGIDGDNIVGAWGGRGYLFDGTNWTPLVYPGSGWTEAHGIDGDRIVGFYSDYLGAPGHGFLYQPDVVIPATIELSPYTINLRSKAKWITCYIELPEGHDVGDIDVSSVKLNDSISAEPKPTAIGDYDGDGITDLMVKFDMSGVQGLPQAGEVELTVTGKLNDGTLFEGSDTIRVINPGK